MEGRYRDADPRPGRPLRRARRAARHRRASPSPRGRRRARGARARTSRRSTSPSLACSPSPQRPRSTRSPRRPRRDTPLSSSPMPRTIASIVDGRPREDAPGGRLTSTNPARTDEVVAEVLLGDAQTFVDACRAARAAQREWAAVPAPVRGRVIANVGRLVEANKEALARLVTQEVGKPYAESLGEVQEIIDTCDFFVGEGRRLYGQTVPSEMPDKQLFTFRVPVGVAAIITAGNFPVAVPSWYLVPAILCGNAVVWKPAEYVARAAATPSRSSSCAGGVPGGVLNLVQADGAATFDGPRARARRGPRRQGRLHRLDAPSARKIGELCGRHLQNAVPRARRQEPARGHGRRRPRPRGRGRAVLRLRHRRAALHVARRGDRPRGRARRVRQAARRAHPRGRDRRPDARTSSTAR